MVSDQIADMLTRIRNAHKSKHPSVYVAASNTKKAILDVFETEGYIAGYEVVEQKPKIKEFKIKLRYDRRGAPAIKDIVRMSKPGRRQYLGKDDIQRNKGGLGIYVLSTSKGMLTDRQAREQGLGGELICSVF